MYKKFKEIECPCEKPLLGELWAITSLGKDNKWLRTFSGCRTYSDDVLWAYFKTLDGSLNYELYYNSRWKNSVEGISNIPRDKGKYLVRAQAENASIHDRLKLINKELTKHGLRPLEISCIKGFTKYYYVEVEGYWVSEIWKQSLVTWFIKYITYLDDGYTYLHPRVFKYLLPLIKKNNYENYYSDSGSNHARSGFVAILEGGNNLNPTLHPLTLRKESEDEDN